MATYSEAEAKNRLSELIDDVLKGEDVVITRRGRPTVKLTPVLKQVPKQARPVTAADLDWLKRRRVGRLSSTEDAGTLLSRMRDEDWR